MRKILIIVVLIFGISQANAQCCDANVKTSTRQTKVQTIKLKITGMTCAGCSNHISTALKNVNGVIENKVEYPGDLATIKYESTKTNTIEIIRVIEKTGYKAEIIKETKSKKKV